MITINGTTGIAGTNGSAGTPAVQGEDTNTGIFFPAADTVAVATAGTERLRVDSSGNVGIGTTSPASFAGAVKLVVGSAATTTTPGAVTVYSGTATYGGLYFADGTVGDQLYRGAVEYNHSTDALLLYSTGTERARIDASGNLLVGDTAPVSGERLRVVGSNNSHMTRFIHTGATPYGPVVQYTSASPNNTSSEFYQANDSTTLRFAVRSNGGIVNFSANNGNLSDRREKTNIEAAGDYLSKVCAIPVVTFNYIDQNMEEDPGLTLGVVAQDVQAVAPELVMESNWGTEETPKMRLSIYQTDLQYALMKAIQELKAEVDSLKAQLEAAQ